MQKTEDLNIRGVSLAERYSYCWKRFCLLAAATLYQFMHINSALLFKL